MVADLQPGEFVVAEKIDRIRQLQPTEAVQLVASIRSKGAKLAVPGLIDLSDLADETDGVTRIVLESVEQLLLKLAPQMARDDETIQITLYYRNVFRSRHRLSRIRFHSDNIRVSPSAIHEA
jgi:hypothetical protein